MRIHLPTALEDIALVRRDEYEAVIRGMAVATEDEGLRALLLRVANNLGALATSSEAVELNDLRNLLLEDERATAKNLERVGDILVREGILRRRMEHSAERGFWWNLPSSGALMDAVVRGRKELLRRIRQSKRSEVLRSTLEKKTLRSSPLPMTFHIADVIGREDVLRLRTASGDMLRIERERR